MLPPHQNQGINQIHEIIRAPRPSVSFIDEGQRVTVKDIGSVSEIKHWAAINGAEVFEEELASQFRCNGSDGYLAWLDNVLGIRETANYDLDGINYEFLSLDTPEEMMELAREEGYELSDAELKDISGGKWGDCGGRTQCRAPYRR